jgi:hypothetical protein
MKVPAMPRFLAAALCATAMTLQMPAVVAAADAADTLRSECRKQLNLGDRGCDCIGDRAEETLNHKQQAMVVAMVTKDQAASATLRGEMTVEELTGAASFMMNAPKTCGPN